MKDIRKLERIAATVTEGSKLLGITRPAFHALLKQYNIPIAKFSKKLWLISYKSLEQLLEKKLKESTNEEAKNQSN